MNGRQERPPVGEENRVHVYRPAMPEPDAVRQGLLRNIRPGMGLRSMFALTTFLHDLDTAQAAGVFPGAVVSESPSARPPAATRREVAPPTNETYRIYGAVVTRRFGDGAPLNTHELARSLGVTVGQVMNGLKPLIDVGVVNRTEDGFRVSTRNVPEPPPLPPKRKEPASVSKPAPADTSAPVPIERRPPSVVVWSNFDTETEEVMSPAEIVTEYRVKPGTVDTLLEAEVPLAQIPKLLEIRDLDETRASSPHGDMVSIANLLDAYMLTEGDVRLISEIVNIARDRRNEERRIRNPLHVSVNEVIGRVLADAREALEESGNLNRLSVEDY